MNFQRIQYNIRRKKIIISNWEYWSFNILYFPIYFYWLWLSIKARSLFFFSTSNPSIENAGFMMESKKKIYDILPKNYYPKTALVKGNLNKTEIDKLIHQHQLVFPLVAKPDIGERGNAVKKMYSSDDIIDYKKNTKVDFLLQEWCNYENEIGVFYCKYPNTNMGFITGIVEKEFMTLKGNGINTIEELVLQNDRFFLQYNTLKNQQPHKLQQVLKKDEKEVLIPYGNHCRGTKFLDCTHKVDDDLNNTFNNICNLIPGFYFGRMDIRFKSWEDLREGKNFSIIELNGAGSEPTHIYDPMHSVFFAWKEIMKHLNLLYKIAKINKQKFNLNYITFREGVQLFKKRKKYNQLINLNV